ncbi:MAG TPA: MBL fold metallo-hydrolase [Gemmatimonadales bacterium]|nr:MBL fold metallo-hydrolase [Gemmatimonadales bacterium]
MPLTQSITLGRFKIHLLEGGTLRLDGGAMFGVVPKTLWSRKVVPDELNRITLAMRSLLIEHPDGLVLVETGLGNKEEQKFRDIYGVDNAGSGGGTKLDDAIVEAGHRREDIRWVINTHLHFDHAGGNTSIDGWGDGGKGGGGSLPARPPARLSFPNARYVVQANELEFARHLNERTRASYLADNFEPVARADRWHVLQGETSVVPGLSVRLTPGHVPWHQSIIIQSGGETLVYLGDIVPTRHHLPVAWAMGYDLEPLRVLETRRALLQQAVAEGWKLCFGHDPDIAIGRAVAEAKGVGLVETVKAAY